MSLEQKNIEIGKMLGWEYFPESKRSVEWEDGTHIEFETTDVWILNPTQKYKDDPCHYGFDLYYDDEVEQKDLFENYAYSLPFNDSWHFLMVALEFVESLPKVCSIISSSKTETICEIFIMDEPFKIVRSHSSKNEAIFQALCHFAKHYNEQNSNSNVTAQL